MSAEAIALLLTIITPRIDTPITISITLLNSHKKNEDSRSYSYDVKQACAPDYDFVSVPDDENGDCG
jgi:ABC-type molybdate transport system substrate-binding protein